MLNNDKLLHRFIYYVTIVDSLRLVLIIQLAPSYKHLHTQWLFCFKDCGQIYGNIEGGGGESPSAKVQVNSEEGMGGVYDCKNLDLLPYVYRKNPSYLVIYKTYNKSKCERLIYLFLRRGWKV